MVSRDYTKEVGLDSGQKTVSKPVAAAVLAVIAVAGWVGVQTLASRPEHREVPAPTAAVPTHH